MFLGKSFLKIYGKFTRENPCRSAISIKLQSSFTEIALRCGCSPVNLLHTFRTPFPRTPLEDYFWIPVKSLNICWKEDKALLALNILSLDTKLLIMKADRQILKCMPAYFEIRELFHIATSILISLLNRRNNSSCTDKLAYRPKPTQLEIYPVMQ